MNSRVNLKKVLMEMGNRLVMDHNYRPTEVPPCSPGLGFELWMRAFRRSVAPVAVFTAWVNQNPEAWQVLADLGMEWPLTPEQVQKAQEAEEEGCRY